MVIRFSLFIFLWLAVVSHSTGQEDSDRFEKKSVPAGFSYKEWKNMSRRWQPYSSWALIANKENVSAEGQVTWLNDTLLVLQQNRFLPNAAFNQQDYILLNIKDIIRIDLRESGHPYKGLISGMISGTIPGVLTGLILAQGWTIIPAIVLGTVTGAGGGLVGSVIQKAARSEELSPQNGIWNPAQMRMLKKSSLFSDSLPYVFKELMFLEGAENPAETAGKSDREGFESIIPYSNALQKAFPDNKWTLSFGSGLMTHSIRKKLQNWYISPLWGPPDGYYETRISLQADLARKIGKQFETGLLVNFIPGDISYSYLYKTLPDFNVSYSFNHSFKQAIIGIYGGYLLRPPGRFYSQRLTGTIQAGLVASDIYEHFYYQWRQLDDMTKEGDKLSQIHYWRPGGLIRLKAAYHLIPGFSFNIAAEGFWIRHVQFNERTILPVTANGPQSISMHRLNFSNVQLLAGINIHFMNK